MYKLRRAVFALLALAQLTVAQTITGSISGTVTDQSGAAIPNLKVTAINTSRNTTHEAITDAQGTFTITNLLPATYNIVVEASGFKRFEKTGVVLNTNENISVGTLALEVGSVNQTIQVSAQGQALETETAQRATTIVGKQLQDIEVNGRSYLGLLRVVPGTYTDLDTSVSNNQTGNIYINGSRGDQMNITLNGASNLDTGSNTKMFATISLDSVQEFQVLTSNYQAQYGKAGGAQIIVISKSGTSDFHGEAYWFYRDQGLNANTWLDNRDGIAKPAYHFNDAGYMIGGPVYGPGRFSHLRDKLFFFWSQEIQRQLIPQSLYRITVPTALERQGNFSQSVNSSGNRFNTIKDPLSSQPCTSTNTAGCFSYNGVLGAIPPSRLYSPGLALLNLFPLPNTTGIGFNYQSQVSGTEPRDEQMLRIDWNATSKWRFYGSLANLQQDVLTTDYCSSGYSLCPNFPITGIAYNHPGYVLTLNATTTISPTLVNEAMWDIGHHPTTVLPSNPNAFTRSATGIDLPTFYTPYDDWIPSFNFGGSRIANSPSLNTGGGAFSPFYTYNTTMEWIDNLSKVWGQHLVKTGLFIQRNRKNQSVFALTSGSYNFGDNSSNPYDTGFGFANAAVGVYQSFTQANNYLIGAYRYTNAEWYLQDTWKIKPRFTLDYGVRWYWVQPQYDSRLQTSNFFPNDYNYSQAVRLYWPTNNCPSGVTKCGVDLATGQTVSSAYIGYIVPNSGNIANGIVQPGKQVNKYLMRDPGILWAPRLGFAWDITGRQNLVFRAGGGIFYDRYQGNEIFNLLPNPPQELQPTAINGFVNQISTNNALLSPASITAISYTGEVPTITNYSAGIQAKLPFQMVLDTSYVGSISRHLLANLNLNPVYYGAAFLPQNQDPTKVKANPNAPLGSNSYDANFLRPYPGYGNFTLEEFGATSNYNSLQVTLNRRFASGLFLQASYTWSKCLDTTSSDGGSFRIDSLTREANYGPCDFNVPQNFVADYVYPLPRIASHLGRANNAVTRALLNDWQISGISNFRNGLPYSVNFNVPGYSSVNFTGSLTESARIWLVGNPLTGTTDSPYNRLNPAAFLPPPIGSIGNTAPRNYLVGPGVNDWDMSLQKSIHITERVHAELRGDAFNVFNHTQFSGINNTINFQSLANPVPTNLPFNSAGQLVNKNGFGTINGVRSPRIMQLMLRIVF